MEAIIWELDHQEPSVRFQEVVRTGPHLLLAGRSKASIGPAIDVPKPRKEAGQRGGASGQCSASAGW